MVRAAMRGAGLFSLGLLLLVQLMAVSPALHAWAHKDAGSPGHECAVTLFLHGQVHSATTAVEPAKQPAVLVAPAPARLVDFLSTDIRLLPSRGPPA